MDKVRKDITNHNIEVMGKEKKIVVDGGCI